MIEGGYVKIYRSFTKKGYYSDSEYVHLWVHLIMKATYQEKEYLFNGKIEYLKPGQFITGRNSLVKETHINRNKVERILKVFESEQQIEQQKTNKFRIISICNWEQYQSNEQLNEPQVSIKRATSEQQVSTINKEKNIKKDKKYNIKIVFEDKKFKNIPEELKVKWREVAPGVDINAEISKAELWVISNPEKKRSKWTAFLSNWMIKAQNNFIKYGGNTNGKQEGFNAGQRNSTRFVRTEREAINAEACDDAEQITKEYKIKQATAAGGGKKNT